MAVPMSGCTGMPIRPKPGSLMAGRRTSKPATRPSRLNSTPSIQPTVTPATPRPRKLHARIAWRKPDDAAVRAEILAERGREKGDAGFRNGGGDMRDEGVGVRSRPRLVVARTSIGVVLHGGPHAGDQRLCRLALDGGDQVRHLPEPARVGRPVVRPDWRAPADLVEPCVARRAFFLDHDPGVMRENAAPAADACGIDVDHRLRLGGGRRQQAGACPVGLRPGSRPVGREPPRGMEPERQEEDQENGEDHASRPRHRSLLKRETMAASRRDFSHQAASAAIRAPLWRDVTPPGLRGCVPMSARPCGSSSRRTSRSASGRGRRRARNRPAGYRAPACA